MKTNFIQYANFLLLLIAISYSFWIHIHQPKVAYVQSAIIVEQYQGMKEARTLYHNKLNSWQQNINKLKQNYQTVLAKYTNEKNSVNRKKLKEHLESAKMTFDKYVIEAERNSKLEEETIIQGALNQVNQLVEDYSKRKNYQLVLGVTLSGNILYGADEIDITNQVLEELNKNYQSR